MSNETNKQKWQLVDSFLNMYYEAEMKNGSPKTTTKVYLVISGIKVATITKKSAEQILSAGVDAELGLVGERQNGSMDAIRICI